MRRRRHVLQVSTFPFLAVLLCAMGSLILLLLVIDRRAKWVARAKARQAALQAEAERQQAADTARAEWERRRQEAHAAQSEQNRRAAAEVHAAREQVQTAAARSQQEEARYRELRERLLAESTKLTRQEHDLAARLGQVEEAKRQTVAADSELGRMVSDLEHLERAIAELKAARQRDQKTYSLVPYRGNRGDNRKPLYVECTADGVMFHPDRVAVRWSATSPAELRAEVARRLCVAAGKPAEKPEEKGDQLPYLLLLVRPDGVTSYYRVLAGLAGLSFDYGYEFVEQDWALDFPEAEGGAPSQPWMAGEPKRKSDRPAPPPSADRVAARGQTGPGGGSSSPPHRPDQADSAGAGRGVAQGTPLAPALGSPASATPAPESSNTGAGPATPPRTSAGSAVRLPGTSAPERTAPERGSHSSPTSPARPRPGEGPSDGPDERAGPVPRPALAATGLEKPKEPATPPPPRRVGNRDWVIPVECTADAVVLYPSRLRIPTATLAKGDNVLLQNVRQMIARRQAGLRPDEPPYRPQVRFLVRPDGLGSYYQAYPLLESLRIPMTRQNLDQDEDVLSRIAGN